MSFPKSLADVPTNTPEQYPGIFSNGSTTRPAGSQEIRQVNYTEGLEVGYRWYESQGIEPLFAFGHGLSYTDFEYSQVQVTPKSTDGVKEIRIRFRLTNTGEREGTEIAQAYVELPDSAGEPSQRLVGWEHVTLQPGEHRNVEITLSSEDLPTCGCCSTGTPTPRRGRPRRARTPCTSAVRSTPSDVAVPHQVARRHDGGGRRNGMPCSSGRRSSRGVPPSGSSAGYERGCMVNS